MTTTFIQGKEGTINYFRMKDLRTGKKYWKAVVGRKALRGIYRRKEDAKMYAYAVLSRYKRLLDAKEYLEKTGENV